VIETVSPINFHSIVTVLTELLRLRIFRLNQFTQFIAPTKLAVLIIHECTRRNSDMFRYKFVTYKEKNIANLKKKCQR